jgi:hypothetical protein
MGRGLSEDPLFFAAALAGGAALGEALARPPRDGQPGRAQNEELQEGAPAAEAKLQG